MRHKERTHTHTKKGETSMDTVNAQGHLRMRHKEGTHTHTHTKKGEMYMDTVNCTGSPQDET